ncbi:hypothetical protein KGF56_000586 [Candida oxycetoniae]|uniref:Protein transport protein SEC23 n=1 Tax=Candida oxycetoniae TaxID=497107 RepID=A0AAI9T114_9ASCO|nr:uncharacterized protein KGF56_000586 [Candida oxycetoniae]KAI3406455.2 hypothetical protein KGF56_000586 [Candida oxycetoniae]
MEFENREDRDGIRLSWSSVAKSKLQHQRNVIPLGALYTPLNDKSQVELLDTSLLVACRSCRSILNPFVSVANDGQLWTCQFCGVSNQLAPSFDSNGEQIFHPSLTPEFTCVEYETGKKSSLPPVFLYIVDTCFEGDDRETAFAQLKESLVISLSILPEDALVGFITFGKHVKIHDLASNDNLSYTFNGNKTYTLEQLRSSLGILGAGLSAAGINQAMGSAIHNNNNNNSSSGSSPIGSVGKRFLQPVGLVEYQLTSIIENLVPNLFSRDTFNERPERATGSAINVAALLLRAIFADAHLTGGHLMVFTSGVCTLGPGRIVDRELKVPMRSHHDIIKSYTTTIQAPSVSSKTKTDISLFKLAKKFYGGLAKILNNLGFSCDFFIGSYDQVGLFEMDEICYKTGGSVVLSDSFSTAIFKQSFTKFFKKQHDYNEYLDMGFNSTLEVKVCSDLKVEGLVGQATALPYNRTNPINERMISQTEIGEAKTNSWKLCSVNPQSTFAVYFEKLDSTTTNPTCIQYLFHYQHPNGDMRLRVTTVAINVIPDSDSLNLELGFDQEAAVVLIAREAIIKLQIDSTNDKKFVSSNSLSKSLDQTLIDFCTRFGVFTIGRMDSFRLSNAFSLFPQFIYHLKRSPFIDVFNSSPDETSYIRHIFMHEDLSNSLLMIQPSLLSYDINTWGSVIDDETGETVNEPEPVLLDSISLGHSKILLLDTFFQILIYHGSQVAEWRKAGYHEQEEYEYFNEFLKAPKREALELLTDRFPLPRFIDCDEGGSQARFLMAKLNPSTSYAVNVNHYYGYGERLDVFTDDVSLQSYMDHIQRVVTSKK